SKAFAGVTLLAVVCAGCAIGAHPYEEPSSGPVTSVTFRNATTGGSYVWIYGDAARCSRRRNAGAIPPSGTKDMRVRANRELALTFGYGTRRMTNIIITCKVTVSFTPEAQKSYEVTFSSTRDLSRCYVDVGEKNPLGLGGSASIEARHRIFKNGWDEDSDFCQPLASATAASPGGKVDTPTDSPPAAAGPVQLDDLRDLMQK
ncbi:MAG: hypothetical protein WCA01_12700, partial [Burkholderiales bacterium]